MQFQSRHYVIALGADWLKITMDHAIGFDWSITSVHVTGDILLVGLEGASVFSAWSKDDQYVDA